MEYVWFAYTIACDDFGCEFINYYEIFSTEEKAKAHCEEQNKYIWCDCDKWQYEKVNIN